WRDTGRLPARSGMVGGLLAIAAGAAVAAAVPLVLPGPVGVYLAAFLIGAGIGISTLLAFAHLADSTPRERLGRTMGSAELGRELGDAGGPLLVGGIAVVAGLPWGLGALAAVVAAAGLAAPRPLDAAPGG